MNAIRRIRKNVFNLKQQDFAALIGAGQSSLSRWENGQSSPTLTDLTRIREEALRLRLGWNDSWFFADAPTAPSRASIPQLVNEEV